MCLGVRRFNIDCLPLTFLFFMKLNVEPMMEEPEGAPEGWGVWDDEIADRTVIYMAGRLASGHKFRKTAWRGGDAEEVLYNHDKAKEERKRKRKREAGGPKSGAVAGPLLKQRRLGAYFKKHALADTGNNAELLARIQALEKTVSWLKRKVNKRRKLGVTPRRELMRSGKPLKRIRKEMPTGSREDEECEEDEGDKGGRNVDDAGEDGGEDESDEDGNGSAKGVDEKRGSEDDLADEDLGLDGTEATERASWKDWQ